MERTCARRGIPCVADLVGPSAESGVKARSPTIVWGSEGSRLRQPNPAQGCPQNRPGRRPEPHYVKLMDWLLGRDQEIVEMAKQLDIAGPPSNAGVGPARRDEGQRRQRTAAAADRAAQGNITGNL
jgi:hypothetical protein